MIFFRNFFQKVLVVRKKTVPLHSQSGKQPVTTMGYGVMVTLQILGLSFLVRVRVSQHRASYNVRCFFFRPYILDNYIVHDRGVSFRCYKCKTPSIHYRIEGVLICYLFSASIALIFSLTSLRSSLSFSTFRFISSIKLFPFLLEALRNPRLFSYVLISPFKAS